MLKRILLVTITVPVFLFFTAHHKIYASANCNDRNYRTIHQLFKSLEAAVKNTLAHTGKDVVIEI